MNSEPQSIPCPNCSISRSFLRFLPCSDQICDSCLKICIKNDKVTCPNCQQIFPTQKEEAYPLIFPGTIICAICTKPKDYTDFWYCDECVVLICSLCCLRDHAKKFEDHSVLEWSATPEPILCCYKNLLSFKDCDLGNSINFDKMMSPVLKNLNELVQKHRGSVKNLAEQLQLTYSIPNCKPNPEGKAEKLESHVKMAELALSQAGVGSQLKRLQGLGSDPETLAQIIFNQLNFGTPENSENSCKCEAKGSKLCSKETQTDFSASLNPLELLKATTEDKPSSSKKEKTLKETTTSKQSVQTAQQKSGPKNDKGFSFQVQFNEEPLFVFGPKKYFVLCTDHLVEIWTWNLDSAPRQMGQISCKLEVDYFQDAAISDTEDKLFLLNCKDESSEWSVVVATLSTAELVDCIVIKTDPKIETGCICATDSGVCYLLLNSDNNKKSSHFWRISPLQHQQEKRLQPELEFHFEIVTATSFAHQKHLLAAAEADRPRVHLFLWTRLGNSDEVQALSMISTVQNVICISFNADCSTLSVCCKDKLQIWNIVDRNNVKKSSEEAVTVKSEWSLGFMNQVLVAGLFDKHSRFINLHCA